MIADVTTPLEVVRWWSAAHRDWFCQRPDFDARFRVQFLLVHRCAAVGGLDDWGRQCRRRAGAADPAGPVSAQCVPRHGSHVCHDARARAVAKAVVDAGLDAQVNPALRLLFYLPFAHSEDPDGQRLSILLHRRLGQPWLDHALGHQAIVERFGRFPHRNILLGRSTTAGEQSFLSEGGFAG